MSDVRERWARFTREELEEIRLAFEAQEIDGTYQDFDLSERLYNEVDALIQAREAVS